MTEIKSFKATHYNQEKVDDLANVVCPPYDVISEQQQSQLYNTHENNFIKVLLGKDKGNDDKKNNKYTRAKKTFEAWLQQGILVEDDKPGIYYYKQEYKVRGERHGRLGFIALMKIQNEKNATIFPHENTHSKAKEDRFKLWRTLSANLSPIFVCFSDKEKKVEKIFNKQVLSTSPIFEIAEDDVKHVLWKLDEAPYIKEITDALSNQYMFIADGHHRYEVAKDLKAWKKSKQETTTGKEPFNYVMTYFTNMDTKDLMIFPMHRIVKSLPKEIDFLEEYFRIDKIKTKEDLVILLAKAGKNEYAFGLYTKNDILLLRLKNKRLIDKHITEGTSDFRSLDATILKFFVFDRVGVPSEDIIYTKDVAEGTQMVDSGEAAAVFIMNPVKINQLKAIALNGERMPPKTTYFYPKVLSGLTVYQMD
ncbi:MAG: DUF1015 domain-containing protein [Candidatus Omnitrophica bacterium]|nr:DUF1015 domain-containing protein [Candidatus Omnitrophota bacterium]